MDKAPDYESGDSRFESWQVRNFSIRERQAAINSLAGRWSTRGDGVSDKPTNIPYIRWTNSGLFTGYYSSRLDGTTIQ